MSETRIRFMNSTGMAMLALVVIAANHQRMCDGAEFLGIPSGPYLGASRALDTSSDGSVVTGHWTPADRDSRCGGGSIDCILRAPFVWDESGGIRSLPGREFDSAPFPGSISGAPFPARAVSGDGAHIVGQTSTLHPYVWNNASGVTLLEADVRLRGEAYDVSDDGSVVVGAIGEDQPIADPMFPGDFQAFRWTREDGLVGLGSLNGGGFQSVAVSTSSDGSVIAGQSKYAIDSRAQAFVWYEDTGMMGLGFLDEDNFSSAMAVSADGTTVVGLSGVYNGLADASSRGFLWTDENGMQEIGDFWPRGTDAKGTVVVGMSSGSAVIWDAKRGLRNLQDVLIDDYGLGTELAGWSLEAANAISADGSTIVGRGRDPVGLQRAWRAVLGSAGNDVPLQPGDANQDQAFDQRDLVQVLQRGKYLTGRAATWGDGDWDGAPGGSHGDPPQGNGLFDQFDIIAAAGNGLYLVGPHAVVTDRGSEIDDPTSIIDHPGRGEVSVDAPAGQEMTSINIDLAAGIFTGAVTEDADGSFDHDSDGNIGNATFGENIGSIGLENVVATELAKDLVLNDQTAIGPLAGGGDLAHVDLIYVPEPTALALLGIGLLGLLGGRRLRPRSCRPYGQNIGPKCNCRI